MSYLFGWVPPDLSDDVSAASEHAIDIANAMSAALRVHDGQQIDITAMRTATVGVVEPPATGGQLDDLTPARSADGRFMLWLAGEIAASDDPQLPLPHVDHSRTNAFRRALLSRWLAAGVSVIAALDGEFHAAIWDSRERTLTIVNDRFGGLPLYWAASSEGVAFAGGVRGVLMAPGISSAPDVEALREAVTFGGFRLGDRTNVAAVRMMPGGSVMTIRRDGVRLARYWNWRDIAVSPRGDRAEMPEMPEMPEMIDELCRRWQTAITRRLAGRGRFGQTLSGGLDSRAILAEAAPRARGGWTAITYGLPGCDDARYAERAARAARADWRFHELYGGRNPDWLDRRAGFIQQTDGLIQLGDLMHVEALDLQRSCFDVHLSGYLGDVVSGPTYADIDCVDRGMHALPYYDTPVSLPYDEAHDRVRKATEGLTGSSLRFLVFDHKHPQSTNRWTAAMRPWLRVRKPFLDYALFDFLQELPPEIRTVGRLHERWLAATYPECFRSIPNQKTGVPVMAPRWRWQLARAARRAGVLAGRALPSVWRPAPRVRSYHDDDTVWRRAEYAGRILDPIRAPSSLVSGILGRDAITGVVDRWQTAALAPAQVIGALHVYESYHRDLADTLRRARIRARAVGRLAPTSNV